LSKKTVKDAIEVFKEKILEGKLTEAFSIYDELVEQGLNKNLYQKNKIYFELLSTTKRELKGNPSNGQAWHSLMVLYILQEHYKKAMNAYFQMKRFYTHFQLRPDEKYQTLLANLLSKEEFTRLEELSQQHKSMILQQTSKLLSPPKQKAMQNSIVGDTQVKDYSSIDYQIFYEKVRDELILNQVIDKSLVILHDHGYTDNIDDYINDDSEKMMKTNIKQLYHLLGYCYYLRGNLKRALDIYNILIVDVPFGLEDRDFLVCDFSMKDGAYYECTDILNRYYDELADDKENVVQFTDELKKGTTHKLNIYYDLGFIYDNLDYYDYALFYYKKYLEKKPYNSETWLRVGDLHRFTGELYSALQCYKNAEKYASPDERCEYENFEDFIEEIHNEIIKMMDNIPFRLLY